MKRFMAIVAALLACGGTVRAEGDASKAMADIADKTRGALVTITGTLRDESGSSPISGLGICIDPAGIFVTASIDSSVQADTLKELKVRFPAWTEKAFDAKLLGFEQENGLAFLKVESGEKWNAVKFARQSNLSVGQKVISVGLMSNDLGNVPYLGLGYISTKVRVPETLVYVTGGKLTLTGSPVFTEDGAAVGLVGKQQLYVSYQMAMQNARGPMNIGLSGHQETSFFLPVEEFASSLENIPQPGQVRRMAWVGVVRFEGVGKELAEVQKLTKPAVLADQIVPGQPAAEAGLRDRDIIIGLNGKDLEKLPTPEMTAQNFIRQIIRMKVGDKATFTLWRDQKPVDISMSLAAMPERPDEAKRYIGAKLGLVVRNKVMLDQYLDTSPTAGVPGLVVIFVGRSSAAENASLQAGDVITSVNDQPIKDVDTFRQIVDAAVAATPPKAIKMTLRRGDQTQSVTIQPPASQPAK